MNLYVDGFTIGSNPSDTGGGFTVCEENGTPHGKLLTVERFLKAGYTNNEAEIQALHWAVMYCSPESTIFTDSQNSISWIKSGRSKARPDLNYIIGLTKNYINAKDLYIIWVPREQNIAGVYNEEVLHC